MSVTDAQHAAEVLSGVTVMSCLAREYLRDVHGGDSMDFHLSPDQVQLCGGEPDPSQPTSHISGYKWLTRTKRALIELLKNDKPITKKAKAETLRYLEHFAPGFDDSDDESVDGLDTCKIRQDEEEEEEEEVEAELVDKEEEGEEEEEEEDDDDDDDDDYEGEAGEEDDSEEEDDDEEAAADDEDAPAADSEDEEEEEVEAVVEDEAVPAAADEDSDDEIAARCVD